MCTLPPGSLTAYWALSMKCNHVVTRNKPWCLGSPGRGSQEKPCAGLGGALSSASNPSYSDYQRPGLDADRVVFLKVGCSISWFFGVLLLCIDDFFHHNIDIPANAQEIKSITPALFSILQSSCCAGFPLYNQGLRLSSDFLARKQLLSFGGGHV